MPILHLCPRPQESTSSGADTGSDPTADVGEVSKFRWKVERSHGWLDNWRRLVTRYDWYTQSYVAFLTIACFMVALSRILG
jgi:transposase